MSIRFAAALAACLSCSAVLADTDYDGNADSLESVVVTASRVAQPIADVIGSVTVITREEIERRQVQSVQDLLRGEAGIDIYNNGGLGKVSAIFMRGANSAQTLILVDGQRLGSATDGTTAIQFIPIDQIERIEIVRGPRSSLYGSDAIGGVIQIFTRQANGLTASVGYGSHNTQNYTAGFGFNENGLRFSATGNYLQSNGFNSCRGDPVTFAGCGANEPDDDGYRNSSASTHIGYAFGKVADLEVNALYSTGYTEYDGYFNQGRFKETSPGVKLLLTPSNTVSITLTGGITQDNQDNYHDAQFLSRYNTEKHNASLLADWSVAKDQRISFGGDYLHDGIDTVLDPTDPSVIYAANSRSSHGEFVQYLGKISAQELSASVRRDDSSQYGSYNTGNLGWKWQAVKNALAFNAGWGKAFHAPTFNDLYFPFGSGNPDLKPERSNSIEVGASGGIDWLTWSLQSYVTHVDDLIALDSSFRPINTDAELRGAELTLNGHVKNFSTGIIYTALDPRSRESGPNYNHLLPRRARQSGRIDFDYNVGSTQLSSIINVVGPRYDDLANTKPLGGYTTVDFMISNKLSKQLTLQLKVGNAFDHRYETAQFYNQDGRNYGVTLRYQPTK